MSKIAGAPAFDKEIRVRYFYLRREVELLRETNGRFLFCNRDISTKNVQSLLAKAGFNPFEPRDYRGWWTRFGAQEAHSPSPEQIQYRGFFHNFLVDHLVDNLISNGAKAIKNVDVFGINGVLAIPDGATLIPGQSKPIFIEVKTGFDPDFTGNQKQVYPMICTGEHAVSFDPRIRDLGLTPGALMPALDIMLVHTFGPGLPMRAESYCEMYGFRGMSHAH